MSTQPNELDKAIEYYTQSSRQALQDGQTPHLAQLLLAAKRLKELEQKFTNYSNAELLGETERCQVEAIKVRLKEVEKERERLWDLVRYQRAELHQENLISDAEYLALLADSTSKARLETYDDLKHQLTQLRAAYKQALEALTNTIECTYCKRFYERNHMLRSAPFNDCECCNCADVRNAKEILSTPLAIATMKGVGRTRRVVLVHELKQHSPFHPSKLI